MGFEATSKADAGWGHAQVDASDGLYTFDLSFADGESHANVYERLHYLVDRGWFDAQAAYLTVQLFVLNGEYGLFNQVEFLFEITRVGSVLPRIESSFQVRATYTRACVRVRLPASPLSGVFGCPFMIRTAPSAWMGRRCVERRLRTGGTVIHSSQPTNDATTNQAISVDPYADPVMGIFAYMLEALWVVMIISLVVSEVGEMREFCLERSPKRRCVDAYCSGYWSGTAGLWNIIDWAQVRNTVHLRVCLRRVCVCHVSVRAGVRLLVFTRLVCPCSVVGVLRVLRVLRVCVCMCVRACAGSMATLCPIKQTTNKRTIHHSGGHHAGQHGLLAVHRGVDAVRAGADH